MKAPLLYTLTLTVSLLLFSCSKNESGDASHSGAELDELIEDVWIDLNEGKVVSLDKWFAGRQSRTLEWINRDDALGLYKESNERFKVQLCAVVENETPDYTVALVAKMPDSIDRSSFEQLVGAASEKYKVSVEYGIKWLTVDGELDERGEYIPK